jgi:hypothetical protein
MIKVGNIEECINPDCPGKKKSVKTSKTSSKAKSDASQ